MARTGLGRGRKAHSVTPRHPDALGNRRTRISPRIPKQLREWLHRTTRAHAYLLNVVRLYGKESAGRPASDEWRQRALAGDRTILADALATAADQLRAIHAEIETAMQAAAPTAAPPGTTEKISVLQARVARFEALWIAGDLSNAPPMDRPAVNE